MNITNIIYYTRKQGDVTNTTISLRELCLRDGFDLESIFYAARDAVDALDLMSRIRRIVCDSVEYEIETEHFIMFKVTDVRGHVNHLKFKKKGVV